jgi:hypothetical protein
VLLLPDELRSSHTSPEVAFVRVVRSVGRSHK